MGSGRRTREELERIAAESGAPVGAFRRHFACTDGRLAIVGLEAVERASEDLPPAPSIAELTRRVADAFHASLSHDGAEDAFRSIEHHPLGESLLPLWRHEWATRLAHGLAAHAGRTPPNLGDRIVGSMAMELIGIALDEWMHQPTRAPLRDLAAVIASRLDAALGESA